MGLRSPIVQLIISVLALFALTLFAPTTPLQAEPAMPTAGGIFRVGLSNEDNNQSDIGLTLREALLLARGGTGPQGLNRGLDIGETLSVSGCHMGVDGGSNKAVIISGCGAGVVDTIRFSTTEMFHVYEIHSSLPAINDTQPTIIDGTGSSVTPIIDLSPNQMTQGLTVNSSNNVIKGIIIRSNRCNNGIHCPALYGLGLNGDNNLVANVAIYNIQGSGIFIEGEDNEIDNVRIGVPPGNINLCPPIGVGAHGGVTGNGIYFSTGGQNNTVKNSVIGCNGYGDHAPGIYVNSGNGGTVIGPNNQIGTRGSVSAAVLSNSGGGIVLKEPETVTIISNTIGFNGDHGIKLINSSYNTIAGNLIRSNVGDGIFLTSLSNHNQIGGPTALRSYGGNKIVRNGGNGITLASLAGFPTFSPAENRLIGNWIGTQTVVEAAGNEGSGIVLIGAQKNLIGDPTGAPNIIGGNEGYGIWLKESATENKIANNFVGTNGFTPLPNAHSGLLLETGAHHNLIGGAEPTAKNVIGYNGEAGVLLRGAEVTANTLLNNTIGRNGLDGVLLLDGAHGNNVGGAGLFSGLINQIFENKRTGVQMGSGAHHNFIGGNSIYENGSGGVLFWNTNTQHNTLKGSKIYSNQGGYGDGIAQGDGANNSWSQIKSYDNAGLGIDINVTTSNNQLDGPHPTITAIAATDSSVTVTGNATPSNGQTSQVTVELYRVADDPSGYGEGQIYVASGATDADGQFSISFDGVAGCFTVFQTVTTAGGKTSSEFGPNACKGTPQTITFAEIPAQLVGNPPIPVNPTASSGLPVSLVAEGPCQVAQGMVTISGEGLCLLTAQQAGDATYAPAPEKIVQFEIAKKPQTITWDFDETANAKFVNNTPFALAATASSGLPVSYVAQGGCTVNGNLVTLTGDPGSCTLTAQQAGDDEYLPAPAVEKSIQVSKHDQTLTFAPLPDQPTTAPAFALSASASSGLAVSFQAGGVCSVDGNLVTLSGQSGLCTITAYQPGNGAFNAAPEVTWSFKVIDPVKQGQTITFEVPADQVFGNGAFSLSATASSGLPVSFLSLTPNICTVAGNLVTLLTPGLCTIEAQQTGDSVFNAAASVARSFVVADPAKQNQTISFAVIGDQLLGAAPFAVQATASSGLPVTVVSKTPTVCSISGAMITLVASGSCTLVATQPGDAGFNLAAPITRTFLVQAANPATPLVFLPLISR
jgi:parallel beta-helix repeat protein